MYISPKPSFEPERPNRAEQGQIDGQSLYWYRAELAAQPGVEARETVLTLPDGRSMFLSAGGSGSPDESKDEK